MDILNIISMLNKCPSPSGFPHSSLSGVKEIMAPLFDEMRSDSAGNIYGLIKSKNKNAKTLLLDAHIDEIGFVVTGEKNGFLTFAPLGGVDARILPASEVTVLSNPSRRGVICSVPPHLQTSGDADKAPDVKDLYIDIGEESNAKLIPCGTPVVFPKNAARMCGEYVTSPALDDRAGLAAILSACEELKKEEINLNIIAVASTGEELGLRGATVAAFSVFPDAAIAVDVTFGSDFSKDDAVTFPLGSGAAIAVGADITKRMSDKLISLAEKENIAHTVEVCAGSSGTNAHAIQIAREGVATALVSVPIRYMHTPAETADISDIESVAKLLAAFAKDMGGGENA